MYYELPQTARGGLGASPAPRQPEQNRNPDEKSFFTVLDESTGRKYKISLKRSDFGRLKVSKIRKTLAQVAFVDTDEFDLYSPSTAGSSIKLEEWDVGASFDLAEDSILTLRRWGKQEQLLPPHQEVYSVKEPIRDYSQGTGYGPQGGISSPHEKVSAPPALNAEDLEKVSSGWMSGSNLMNPGGLNPAAAESPSKAEDDFVLNQFLKAENSPEHPEAEEGLGAKQGSYIPESQADGTTTLRFDPTATTSSPSNVVVETESIQPEFTRPVLRGGTQSDSYRAVLAEMDSSSPSRVEIDARRRGSEYDKTPPQQLSKAQQEKQLAFYEEWRQQQDQTLGSSAQRAEKPLTTQDHKPLVFDFRSSVNAERVQQQPVTRKNNVVANAPSNDTTLVSSTNASSISVGSEVNGRSNDRTASSRVANNGGQKDDVRPQTVDDSMLNDILLLDSKGPIVLGGGTTANEPSGVKHTDPRLDSTRPRDRTSAQSSRLAAYRQQIASSRKRSETQRGLNSETLPNEAEDEVKSDSRPFSSVITAIRKDRHDTKSIEESREAQVSAAQHQKLQQQARRDAEALILKKHSSPDRAVVDNLRTQLDELQDVAEDRYVKMKMLEDECRALKSISKGQGLEVSDLAEQLRKTQELLDNEKRGFLSLSRSVDKLEGPFADKYFEGDRAEARKVIQHMYNYFLVAEQLKESEQRNDKLEVQLVTERRKRQSLHSLLEELKGNIRVIVRMRPPLLSNSIEGAEHVTISNQFDKTTVTADEHKNVVAFTCPSTTGTKAYEFYRVFGQLTSQRGVFEEMSPLLQSALDGQNVTVMAYGQTSSGKTHTIFGPQVSAALNGSGGNRPPRQAGQVISYLDSSVANQDGDAGDDVGLLPRMLSHLFSLLDTMGNRRGDSKATSSSSTGHQSSSGIVYRVLVSMVELYNEQLFDLLSVSEDDQLVEGLDFDYGKNDPRPNTTGGRGGKSNKATAGRPQLDLRVVNGSPQVLGNLRRYVRTPNEALEVLNQGLQNRTVHATLANATSSRSHAMFTVHIETENRALSAGRSDPHAETKCSKIVFVDLAGSERVSKTQSSGDRLKEAQHINQSLGALGDVVAALSKQHNEAAVKKHHRSSSATQPNSTSGGGGFVPYRNSKLTMMLQESLSGDSKTVLIACIAPNNVPVEVNTHETKSTLQFASRIRVVRTLAGGGSTGTGITGTVNKEVPVVVEDELVPSSGRHHTVHRHHRGREVDILAPPEGESTLGTPNQRYRPTGARSSSTPTQSTRSAAAHIQQNGTPRTGGTAGSRQFVPASGQSPVTLRRMRF